MAETHGASVEIVHATSVAEATDALAATPGADVLAGGTDLMVEVNSRQRDPRTVVSVRRVKELDVWDGRRIGANTTYATMENGPLLALAQAARTVGSPQIRAAGTLGGNLGTASPAGDTLPVLAAFDAEIELTSTSERRVIRWDQFITGVKQTSRAEDELITAAILPDRLPVAQAFAKIGIRNAMVISMVSACAMRWDDGRVSLAMGAIAPVPLRLTRAEAVASSIDSPSDGALHEIEQLVREDVRPITDQRGTAAYRRHAAGVLARRVIERVFT